MTGENGTMFGPESKNGRVSLETLANMTGFPIEMIQAEVFQGKKTNEVSLEELRVAMLSFIDSNMLIKED